MLKFLRQKLGVSQAELSEKVGISHGFLAEIEGERKFPSPEVLEKLATSLEVDAFCLLMSVPQFEELDNNKSLLEIQRSFVGEIIAEIRKLKI